MDKEEPINDEEDHEPVDNDDTLEMPDMHGDIHLLELYDSNSENKDELEGIDGSTIIIDVLKN